MPNSLRPIRICRVVTVPFTFETLLRDQLNYVAHQGLDLTLVSSPGPLLEEVATSLNVNCHPIAMARKPEPVRDLLSLLALTRLFRDQRFDIVHSTTPKAGLLTALAGGVARVPVRIHTFTGQVWVGMQGLSRWFMRQCDWIIGHLNTHCYADSLSQCGFLIKEQLVNASRISVLGPGSISGVDLKRFDPKVFGGDRGATLRRELGISADSFVILFVGRVTKDKGIQELVSAFQMLQVDQMDVDLVMVGPFESDRDPLPKETMDELSNDPRIHLIGFSREPERYMGIADVFCLPSYREGFGSVAIEAAAMGIPAVVSRVVGLVDAVVDGQTGFLVPAREADSLKDALVKILSDSGLRHRMGKIGRERAVQEFDSRIVNRLVVKEYRRLAGRGR